MSLSQHLDQAADRDQRIAVLAEWLEEQLRDRVGKDLAIHLDQLLRELRAAVEAYRRRDDELERLAGRLDQRKQEIQRHETLKNIRQLESHIRRHYP